MGPRPLLGAARALPADPGMDSEGWFAVHGWKYLVKWHHSGSYQLYPGKVPCPHLRTLSRCQGHTDLCGLQVCLPQWDCVGDEGPIGVPVQ